MGNQEPAKYPDAGSSSADYTTFGWRRQFVDDLVAANRFKTFLIVQGANVPLPVLERLGSLSERFEAQIETFIWEERRWLKRWPFRWMVRDKIE
jgi:hypothetical protein